MTSLKINFASLSIGASVDQQTGNLSIFDLLEEIRTPQLPIHLQSLVISLAIEKTEPIEFTGKIMIHLFTPDKQQQVVGTGDMKIPFEQKRMKAVFRFGGFPVTSYGNYRFVVSCLNKSNAKIAEAILDFESIQVQPAPQNVNSGEKPPLAH